MKVALRVPKLTREAKEEEGIVPTTITIAQRIGSSELGET